MLFKNTAAMIRIVKKYLTITLIIFVNYVAKHIFANHYEHSIEKL